MRLIEEIASKDNLNQAFLQVTRNKGASGIDNMTCDEVKDYLKVHGQDLINQILSREYQPLPVRRVEIPKPNGGTRKLGIPTVVDRIVQQAIVQKLSPDDANIKLINIANVKLTTFICQEIAIS